MRTKVVLMVSGAFGVFLICLWAHEAVWIRDYEEAEPLFQKIGSLAHEMKRFSEQHGRSPASFDEMASYSPTHDFSKLRGYTHAFTPSASQRFHLRVNNRFAFAIDDPFTPIWSKPTGVLRAPAQSP